jgi:hypothetical protein|tara:strand:- start:295 stop:1011 length:717 start_codon:yes stop_codon:yes gene_type:complete
MKLINVLQELRETREKSISCDELFSGYKQILEQADLKREQTLEKLNSGNSLIPNYFDIDKIEVEHIFHESQIKKICIDYRLRFLDAVFFKEPYPPEAISKLQELERLHKTTLNGFKIIAPMEAFKLKKADDPLLFAPMGNGYYYLIHKWGTDLHPLRKLKYWAFKNIENLGIALAVISILLTLISYPLFFKRPPTFGYLLMVFMFYFKGIVGMFFIFCGSSGKNFSEYSWQSEHDKIS